MSTSLGRALTPREAARELRCSPATIYRAIETGQLEAVRLGERGSFRIHEDAIGRFLRPVETRRDRSA